VLPSVFIHSFSQNILDGTSITFRLFVAPLRSASRLVALATFRTWACFFASPVRSCHADTSGDQKSSLLQSVMSALRMRIEVMQAYGTPDTPSRTYVLFYLCLIPPPLGTLCPPPHINSIWAKSLNSLSFFLHAIELGSFSTFCFHFGNEAFFARVGRY
jgi:hypothetical protein